MEHILIQDEDCHWYVIPSDKRDAFDTWLDSEDAEAGIAPVWAEEVGGSPTLVKFKNYRIE